MSIHRFSLIAIIMLAVLPGCAKRPSGADLTRQLCLEIPECANERP